MNVGTHFGNNNGMSTKTIYDLCNYERATYDSIRPLQYHLYLGAYENCKKCRPSNNQFVKPTDLAIVDLESELRGITRPLSKCSQFKYTPMCQKSQRCTSTFDRTNPIVYPGELCPIIYNNLPGFPQRNFLPGPSRC